MTIVLSGLDGTITNPHDMRMTRRNRDRRLIELVASQGVTTVESLSRELEIGPATVRRELRRLSVEGRIVRTYGGAMLPGPTYPIAAARAERAIEEKRRIAAAAVALVESGQTLVVTSGSTASEFARQLVDRRDLTVITNSLDVAQILLDREGIQLVVLGGVVRPRMHSLLGHLTEQVCREMRADVLFMGINAISLDQGLMSDHLPEIVTDRALRSMATSVVVMADSAKFELIAPARVFGLEEVDVIVTDGGLRSEVVEELHGRGIQVILA